jgi:hypothetical protein
MSLWNASLPKRHPNFSLSGRHINLCTCRGRKPGREDGNRDAGNPDAKSFSACRRPLHRDGNRDAGRKPGREEFLRLSSTVTSAGEEMKICNVNRKEVSIGLILSPLRHNRDTKSFGLIMYRPFYSVRAQKYVATIHVERLLAEETKVLCTPFESDFQGQLLTDEARAQRGADTCSVRATAINAGAL